jgi:leucyl-tRNA synthetase
MGHPGSVHQQSWPDFDEDLAREERVQVAVQVDGKVRAVIEIDPNLDEAEVKELAFAQPKVQQHLAGREVAQSIYIPGRIVSFVTEKARRNVRPRDEHHPGEHLEPARRAGPLPEAPS